MRPTTAMSRQSDKEWGSGGKSKAPPPPQTKHCTTINITSNGGTSPMTLRNSESRLDGGDGGGDGYQANYSVGSPKKSFAPQPPSSSKSSPAPPPPGKSPASDVMTSGVMTSGMTTTVTVKGVNGHANGQNGHQGNGHRGSYSSISTSSGGSAEFADAADFISSLPDLPAGDVIAPPPMTLTNPSVTSPATQYSFPPSPSTSGYSSPFPSPRTGGDRTAESSVAITRRKMSVDSHDDANYNSSDVSSFTDDVDYDANIIPPPPQFGDGSVDEVAQETTPPSPPPSPPADYLRKPQNDHQPPPPESEKHGKLPRPYSETDMGALSSSFTRPSPSHGRDRPISYAGLDRLDDDYDYNEKEVFHVNVKTTPATSPLTSEKGNAEVVADPQRTFAGRRDVRDPRQLQEKQIVSMRGTVRGFKNRVRAGISTFIDPNTNKFNYRELEKGKIVIYTSSMTVVRETYDRCKVARNILQNHMVRYEERDLYMSQEHQKQIADRLGVEISTDIVLPQVFIDGLHIGGITELEKLNETGELRKILESFPKIQVRTMCNKCGGYRFVPCVVCHGSKKSVHRNNFTEEFYSLRCMQCNENGLQRCHDCLDQQE